MPDIVIHEVGPRDGLQIEKTTVPTEQKIKWVQALDAAGVDLIQVGSFVHKEKVPQMADTDELFRRLAADARPPGVVYSGLVLNERGLERGLACGVDYFCTETSVRRRRRELGFGDHPRDGRGKRGPRTEGSL